MGKFIVSVEATADLTKELLEKYDIRKAEMNFSIDEKEYCTDNLEMSPEIFYNKMRGGSRTSTSQVNSFQAKEYFEKLLEEGKDILHISFTSALSGMYDCMKKTADEINQTSKNKIIVVNSLCAAMGQGLLALIASEKMDDYNTIEAFTGYVESIKMNIDHMFIVDSLKYLSRTGRISKMTAAIGTVLQIKPILHVDNEGHLTNFAKVISRKKSIQTLAEKVANAKNNMSDKIYIAHADCLNEAQTVQQLIEEKTSIKPEILELGYVIGCHAGPGTIAVFFTSDKRQ